MTEEELEGAVIKSLGQSSLTVEEALGLLETDASRLIYELSLTTGEANDVHNWAKFESQRIIGEEQLHGPLEPELQQESISASKLNGLIREAMWKGKDVDDPDAWADDYLAHPFNIEDARYEELARAVSEWIVLGNYSEQGAIEQVAADEDVPLDLVQVAVRDYPWEDFDWEEEGAEFDEIGDPGDPDSWAYDPLLDPLNV